MVSPTFTAGISGIAGAASSIGGIIQSIQAAKQQAKAAKDLAKATEQEMAGLQAESVEVQRVAYQHAVAALEDAAFLEAITAGNIRRLQSQGRMIEGEIEAQTAANGMAFVGSPVLAAAATAGEVARMIGNEHLTQKVGVRQFKFQADEALRAAQNARLATETQLAGLKTVRSAQGAALRMESLRSTVQGFQQVSQALSAGSSLIPPGARLFPRKSPTVLSMSGFSSSYGEDT